jgi:predicted SAM-dependent methyltransferase
MLELLLSTLVFYIFCLKSFYNFALNECPWMLANLGCGDEWFGDVRVDIYRTGSVNVVADCDFSVPFRDRCCDMVYCKNLLEHLKNPFNFLREVYRVLKVGGCVVLVTDNAGYWRFHLSNSRFVRAGVHSGGYESRMLDKHYALFTFEHSMNLFADSGFQIVDIGFCEAPAFGRFSFLRIVIDRILSVFPLFYNLAFPRIFVKAKRIAD